ncbi:MAG: thiol-disulfide oxidoreductase DCC family protein [Candidatus Sumerlaeota bacterium]
MSQENHKHLRVYYDGSCSVCNRFCKMVGRSEHSDRIEMVDFTADGFVPAEEGLGARALEEGLHAKKPDGEIVRDFDAILAVWEALDRKLLSFLGHLPVVHFLMQWGYRFFARHRHWFNREKA